VKVIWSTIWLPGVLSWIVVLLCCESCADLYLITYFFFVLEQWNYGLAWNHISSRSVSLHLVIDLVMSIHLCCKKSW
jgi:hypothetical protein